MTTFLLIRHASHDLVGKALAGRSAGIYLNAAGRTEAQGLALKFGGWRIDAIFSSPAERAQETAAPLARRLGQVIQTDPAFDEIDYGAWTLRTFDELEADSGWQRWNRDRATAKPPGGEGFACVQSRIVSGIQRLSELLPKQTIAIFSHGDVIKSALMHFLGIPFTHIFRLEISPASVSALQIDGTYPCVTLVNSTLSGAR